MIAPVAFIGYCFPTHIHKKDICQICSYDNLSFVGWRIEAVLQAIAMQGTCQKASPLHGMDIILMSGEETKDIWL